MATCVHFSHNTYTRQYERQYDYILKLGIVTQKFKIETWKSQNLSVSVQFIGKGIPYLLPPIFV